MIGSIKTNKITQDTMAIGMGDHRAIHIKGTIIDSIMVITTTITHVNNRKVTKIETSVALAIIATTNVVIEARIGVITVTTKAIKEITVINLETNPTMDINKTITIITGKENLYCQICQVLSPKTV